MYNVAVDVGGTFTDVLVFVHGTNVVTNMILTNTGSRVGLLTTKGHEQILHLARAWTPGPLYGWMALQKPDAPATSCARRIRIFPCPSRRISGRSTASTSGR